MAVAFGVFGSGSNLEDPHPHPKFVNLRALSFTHVLWKYDLYICKVCTCKMYYYVCLEASFYTLNGLDKIWKFSYISKSMKIYDMKLNILGFNESIKIFERFGLKNFKLTRVTWNRRWPWDLIHDLMRNCAGTPLRRELCNGYIHMEIVKKKKNGAKMTSFIIYHFFTKLNLYMECVNECK